MAAIVTIPPIFGAIHWAVSIEPSYVTLVNKKFDNDSVKSLQGQTSKLQIFWQILTFLTRYAILMGSREIAWNRDLS